MVQDAAPSTTDTQVGAVTKDRGGISPRLLGARHPAPFIGKNERKVEPKEIPSRSIFRLVLGYTRQLRILATALPKGLLQSTQSRLAFKTVKENRRKAQQLNAVYSTHSVLTHFRSSFLCIPVRIRTCRTHQSRCMCLRWGKDWGDKSFFLKGQQKLSILNNPTVLNPVILSLTR